LPAEKDRLQLPTSAVNVTLLAFVAECRAVVSAAAPLVVYAQRLATNAPHVGSAVALMGQTDGRTQDHARLCSIYSASSVNNWRETSWHD